MIHSMVAAPGFQVVRQNHGGDLAQGGFVRNSGALGIADDQVGTYVQVSAVLVEAVAVINPGYGRLTRGGVDFPEKLCGNFLQQPITVRGPDDAALLALAPGIDELEIRSAFKRLARKWHPDKQDTDDPRVLEIASRRLGELVIAYEELIRNGGAARP